MIEKAYSILREMGTVKPSTIARELAISTKTAARILAFLEKCGHCKNDLGFYHITFQPGKKYVVIPIFGNIDACEEIDISAWTRKTVTIVEPWPQGCPPWFATPWVRVARDAKVKIVMDTVETREEACINVAHLHPLQRSLEPKTDQP